MNSSDNTIGSVPWLRTGTAIIRTDPDSPRQIVVSRALDVPPFIRGIMSQMVTPPGVINTIILPNPVSATREDVAKLLAVALIYGEYGLFKASILPPNPPTIVLRSDGSFRHQLIRTFGPSVLSTISRIGQRLLVTHDNTLDSILRLTKGRIPIDLERFKSDYLLDSDRYPMYVVNPEPFDLELEELTSTVEGVPRYLQVARDYKQDRYMVHLSTKQLFSRGNDIFRNIPQVDNLGRITLENGNPRHIYWMDLFSEFLQECLMRGISKDVYGPAIADGFPVHGGSDLPKQFGKLVQNSSIPETPYLTKYGKVKHIIDLYEHGLLRITPASDYLDPSLNPARKDNELSKEFEIDRTVVPILGPGAMKYRQRRIPLRMDLNSNYYVTCFSEILRPRLFLDFDAVACIIIKEPDTFRDKAIEQLTKQLPDYEIKADRVTYYDPLCVSPAELEPVFVKRHRYAYQEEVRIVAIPPKPVKSLEPIFLKLGSLTDISELISLPPKN